MTGARSFFFVSASKLTHITYTKIYYAISPESLACRAETDPMVLWARADQGREGADLPEATQVGRAQGIAELCTVFWALFPL